MKQVHYPLLLCLFALSARAQLDSARLLSARGIQKTDSIKSLLQARSVSDTSRYFQYTLDAIKRTVDTQIDSVQNSYTVPVNRINQSLNVLTSRIDSLSKLNLPVNEFTGKLDSTRQELTRIQNDLHEKIELIKSKAFEKLNTVGFPPEINNEVTALESSIRMLQPGNLFNNVPGDQNRVLNLSSIPVVNSPVLSMGVNDLNVPGTDGVSSLTALPVVSQFSTLTEGLKSNKLPDGVEAGDIKGKLHQAKQIKEQPIDKLADSKVSELNEVKEIQQMSHIENMDAIKSEEAMKEELKKQVRAVAIDHFAGKQQQLNSAMDKISKYKSSYPNVSSVANLNAKPSNPMKDKPLLERIIPDINLQVQHRGEDLLIDFNPEVGYEFTGRITGGLGWNQRIGYNWDLRSFHSDARVFGPRTFVEFKLGKGFSPRAEAEIMNTLVPSLTLTKGDPRQRQWVWGVFTGIKKDYKFIGRVKGTATVMVRLLDPKRQSPYGDVINARFGFEFPMKKTS